jgi:tripartite-type tricarboxylate transporter receptor subunit TctC
MQGAWIRLTAGLFAVILSAACAPGAAPAPPTSPPTSAPAPTQPTGVPTAAAKPTEQLPAKPAQAPAPKVEAKAIEEFYRGKTVRIIVGFAPGGGFDVIGRLLARYLGKHIPGNPAIIVENMPGAAGGIAANHLYKAAPKDGTVLSVFAEPKIRDQLLQGEGIEFDARDFSWLGSTQVQTTICIARADTGITNFKDLQAGKELIVGTTGPGSNLHDFPAVLKSVLGANLKLVSGYEGTNRIAVALEGGELSGMCNPWETLNATKSDWFSSNPPYVTNLVQQGTEKHPDLPNVPMAEEFAQSTEDKQIIRAATSTLAISKPLAGPPGMPAERVAALRQALEATMKDPELIAEAEKAQVDLSYKAAEVVEATVKEILDTPPDAAERLKQALRAGG